VRIWSLHRPANDPAAVEVHDGRQMEPSLAGLDVGDVSGPDPVRGRRSKVAIEQIGRDRQVVLAVGGPEPPWPRQDGANTVAAHQPLDATTACPVALGLQFAMDTRAAITFVIVVMDPFDVVQQGEVFGGSAALRARAPGIIAGRRDTEHVAHDPHWIVGAAIFDEAKSHFGTPAKIAIDFLRNSRIGVAGNCLQREAQRFGATL
jgi:hypothetical protein